MSKFFKSKSKKGIQKSENEFLEKTDESLTNSGNSQTQSNSASVTNSESVESFQAETLQQAKKSSSRQLKKSKSKSEEVKTKKSGALKKSTSIKTISSLNDYSSAEQDYISFQKLPDDKIQQEISILQKNSPSLEIFKKLNNLSISQGFPIENAIFMLLGSTVNTTFLIESIINLSFEDNAPKQRPIYWTFRTAPVEQIKILGDQLHEENLDLTKKNFAVDYNKYKSIETDIPLKILYTGDFINMIIIDFPMLTPKDVETKTDRFNLVSKLCSDTMNNNSSVKTLICSSCVADKRWEKMKLLQLSRKLQIPFANSFCFFTDFMWGAQKVNEIQEFDGFLSKTDKFPIEICFGTTLSDEIKDKQKESEFQVNLAKYSARDKLLVENLKKPAETRVSFGISSLLNFLNETSADITKIWLLKFKLYLNSNCEKQTNEVEEIQDKLFGILDISNLRQKIANYVQKFTEKAVFLISSDFFFEFEQSYGQTVEQEEFSWTEGDLISSKVLNCFNADKKLLGKLQIDRIISQFYVLVQNLNLPENEESDTFFSFSDNSTALEHEKSLMNACNFIVQNYAPVLMNLAIQLGENIKISLNRFLCILEETSEYFFLANEVKFQFKSFVDYLGLQYLEKMKQNFFSSEFLATQIQTSYLDDQVSILEKAFFQYISQLKLSIGFSAEVFYFDKKQIDSFFFSSFSRISEEEIGELFQTKAYSKKLEEDRNIAIQNLMFAKKIKEEVKLLKISK